MTHRNILILLSLTLFLISLALPALETQSISGQGTETTSGFIALLLGWLAITDFQPAWLANIFYFVAMIICYTKSKKGFATTIIITIALALCSFFGEFAQQLYIGFYVWLSSMLVLAVANYVERIEKFIADKNNDTS